MISVRLLKPTLPRARRLVLILHQFAMAKIDETGAAHPGGHQETRRCYSDEVQAFDTSAI